MKPKHQRLMLLGCAVGALALAGALSISALGDTATYFYSPTDAAEKGVAAGQPIKLGGLVAMNSVERAADGVTIMFEVTDNAQSVPVKYTGIVPDLFREGQGVIAEGRFDASGTFVADMILAKHDENYMPPEVAGALHKTATVDQ